MCKDNKCIRSSWWSSRMDISDNSTGTVAFVQFNDKILCSQWSNYSLMSFGAFPCFKLDSNMPYSYFIVAECNKKVSTLVIRGLHLYDKEVTVIIFALVRIFENRPL